MRPVDIGAAGIDKHGTIGAFSTPLRVKISGFDDGPSDAAAVTINATAAEENTASTRHKAENHQGGRT